MTRRTISIVLVAAASVVALAAFAASGAQERPTVTFTGCLRTGGSSSVYLLRGAAAPEVQPMEAPGGEAAAAALLEDFLLVSIPSGLDLAPFVNHRIAVSGTVSDAKDPPPPPAGANSAEKAMKKLSVQTVKEVASNCSFD